MDSFNEEVELDFEGDPDEDALNIDADFEDAFLGDENNDNLVNDNNHKNEDEDEMSGVRVMRQDQSVEILVPDTSSKSVNGNSEIGAEGPVVAVIDVTGEFDKVRQLGTGLHSLTNTVFKNIHNAAKVDSIIAPDIGIGSTTANTFASLSIVTGPEINDSKSTDKKQESRPSRIDYRARGYTIKKTEKRKRPWRSPSSGNGKPTKLNPFSGEMEKSEINDNGEPDPTDPETYPPEYIDLTDEEELVVTDDEVMYLGDNRNGLDLGNFGFSFPESVSQNVGRVCRNPHANGYQIGDKMDPDLAEDGDLGETFLPNGNLYKPNGGIGIGRVTRGISRILRDESHYMEILHKTQTNGIQARKMAHKKPITMVDKLLAFNGKINGDGDGGFEDMLSVDCGANGYYTARTIPSHLRKYWDQRYKLFSKYDQGIRMDEESWYSVTPEQIAIQIAQKCRTEGTIIDAFCGCGGNTIQFANYCKKVVAIDIDPKKVEMAMHNARIYGVDHKIDFVVADFMAIAPVLKADVIFLSPPWGGPEYANVPEYDLKTMIPMDGIKLFQLASQVSPNVGYYVPRNTNLDQLRNLAKASGLPIHMEEAWFYDRVKAITAYYGNLTEKSAVSAPRIPGGPARLRHAKEGSPELTDMIF